VLAIVFFSVDLYLLANIFILYSLANVNFFHLKAERTEGRKQHLSKTEGKKLACKFHLLSNLEKQESIILRLINNINYVN
jgi:hypothetical protein